MKIHAGAAAINTSRVAPLTPRFQTVVGQTYEIALQFATGKQVTSRYNNKVEVMYSLTSGPKADFPLDVAAAIDSLTLAPGQPFTICHHGGGSWEVERVYQQQQRPPQQPPPSPPPYQPPPAAAAPAPQHTPQKMNGAGETASEILLGLYPAAIEVALKAAAMAQARGMMVSPTFEDIRTIATTLFINSTGGDR